jgi:hypothetical protein
LLTADFREARPREALGDSSEEDAGNERTAEHDQQRVSLSAQYVRYAFVEQPIVLFYGAGPEISYAREEVREETENVNGRCGIVETRTSSRTLGVGASAVLGASGSCART